MFLPDALLEKLSEMLVHNKQLAEELSSGGVNPIPKYTVKDMNTLALKAQSDTLQHLLSWAMKHNIAMQCGDVLRGSAVAHSTNPSEAHPLVRQDSSPSEGTATPVKDGGSDEPQTEGEEK